MDDLSRMNMGSVSHIEGSKKDLVKYVHMLACLGLRLENSPKGCFIVHHNAESSVELKAEQHLDQPLMDLK